MIYEDMVEGCGCIKNYFEDGLIGTSYCSYHSSEILTSQKPGDDKLLRHLKNIDIPEVPQVDLQEGTVYNTTVDVKRANYDQFANLIRAQFNHGGDKYKLQGFNDREATDVISSIFGGESQHDWILGTMMKYLFRFKNFQREKDLLKIATYCYILWLKIGGHLTVSHDQDVTK